MVADALSRKERVKLVRVRAMNMVIFSDIKGKILEAQNELFKEVNVQGEALRGLDKQMERKEDDAMYFSKGTIQTLEGMLRACLIDFGGSWDTHIPLAKFSYNNSYHTSIRCASFEAFYGQKCCSPIVWAEVGESQMIRPEIIQETIGKTFQIKDRLKAACDRQKSYADNRQKPLEFCVGDHVLLKVFPWKSVVRFGKKNETLHVPLEEIRIDAKFYFIEEPMEIIDREVKNLKRSRILIVKVRWNSKRGPKFTW
nr:putative reverse transcriptase domain-containing protein [Tanacetum cinerariifolium]